MSDEYNRGYVDGEFCMLDRIRSSLKEYPNMGGDIVVMQEVERIVREAIDKSKKGS